MVEQHEADDEPRQQDGRAPGRRAAAAALEEAEYQDDRAEHQHAQQLYQRARLHGDETARRSSGDHLRHGIDGQAGHGAVLRNAQPEIGLRQRQADDDGDAEHGRESQRGRNLFLARIDDGRHGDDGRIAADRVAAGDQQREPGRQAHQAADDETGRNRADDDGEHDRNDGHAGTTDGGQINGRAEKDDRDFEQRLGAEFDARLLRPPRSDDALYGDADKDGQHERFDRRSAEGEMQNSGTAIGRAGDDKTERETGNQACRLWERHEPEISVR